MRPLRDVGHVGPSEERQHVVLAQRVELDVAHQDHALVRLLEEGVAHHVLDRHARSPRVSQRSDASTRSGVLARPCAVRVLAQAGEDGRAPAGRW